jgi:hypothetical protein
MDAREVEPNEVQKLAEQDPSPTCHVVSAGVMAVAGMAARDEDPVGAHHEAPQE